jgi:hypothetical protein
MKKVTLAKDRKIGRKEFKKGAKLSVSEGIYNELISEKAIEVAKKKSVEK